MLRTHLTRLAALEQRAGPVEGPLGLVWLQADGSPDSAAQDIFIAERTAAMLAQGYGQVLVIEFIEPELHVEEPPAEAMIGVSPAIQREEIEPVQGSEVFTITFVEPAPQPEPEDNVAPAPAASPPAATPVYGIIRRAPSTPNRAHYKPYVRRGNGGPHSWMR